MVSKAKKSPATVGLANSRRTSQSAERFSAEAGVAAAKGTAGTAISKKPRWTIMLYIAADSLLTNFAVESLKQLNNSASVPPSLSDKASVVVAAQFGIDAPGGQQIPRYLFNQDSGGDLGRSIKGYLDAPPNMTEQQAVIDFLKWVYEQKECKDSDHYALIFWSHGPELLLQPPPGHPTGDSASLYLTPQELREALNEAPPPNGDKVFDIVAFDACSMNMFEMATEIQKKAHYMVASQEEVPDPSFPYDSLVSLFRRCGNDTEEMLVEGVRTYISTYQDYICSAETGMKRVTLSVLNLKNCGPLEKAIGKLAHALLRSQNDPSLSARLLEARGESRDYAGGLYVDLYEFCTNLYMLLNAVAAPGLAAQPENEPSVFDDGFTKTESDPDAASAVVRNSFSRRKNIADACLLVLKALRLDPAGTSLNGLIRVNCSADARSHGLSLYFPFMGACQYDQVNQPMVKGGEGTIGKGFSDVLNSAAPGLLMSARRDLIVATEGYYGSLQLTSKTAWYTFIVRVWTRILIESDPDALDLHYSAQQAAVNANRARYHR